MKTEVNKKRKKDGPNRKARLILRNIPFKTTENDICKHFEQFGKVTEINILKRPDGKPKGCAFIQFVAVQMAAKALYNTNGKDFMGRPIIIDWAVPKDKFVSQLATSSTNENNTSSQEIKEQNESEAKIEDNDIKEEIVSDEDIKPNEYVLQSELEIEIKSENEEHLTNKDNETSEDESENCESETNISEKNENNLLLNSSNLSNKPKFMSHDISEGRTVFVKNIPFSATNDHLKECMRQFGTVFYALICKDRFTEHSKGTGFVKFVEKEAAEKCLQAGTELTLLGNILDCHVALDKKDILKKSEETNKKERDSRNLYLIKEGVILAGSIAANGVSKADMEKRLQLEQWKSQILRNLHMFVSRNRLVIHNLPYSWDDKKLKALFLKHGGQNAIITEARVMRDLRNVDGKGVGKSKEYGFVTFTKHENALIALRSLNNNPQIFTPGRRPIVAFSIENKIMVNAKQRRIQKSKQKNPLCKEYQPEPEDNLEQNRNVTNNTTIKSKKRKQPFEKFTSDKKKKLTNDLNENFSGIAAKPGIPKLRSKFKLQTQAKMHHERLKKEKKLKRAKNQLASNTRTKQPKQKMKRKKEEADNFVNMVNKYKASLVANNVKKNKWYE